MFCKVFNKPLNNWNVSNVKVMSTMFENCKEFNQPLNNWKVDNVEDITGIKEIRSNTVLVLEDIDSLFVERRSNDSNKNMITFSSLVLDGL